MASAASLKSQCYSLLADGHTFGMWAFLIQQVTSGQREGVGVTLTG